VLVALHTAVIGRRPRVSLASLMDAHRRVAALADARTGERAVWFDDGALPTPIYARALLPLGAAFKGPAVLEQLDSTTVVDPDCTVEVDAVGNLVITVPQRARGG
jgi:N-methylhydantoinase A